MVISSMKIIMKKNGAIYFGLIVVIMTQPSSTIIVYVLDLFIVALGIKFLKRHEDQLSRQWWGISMIFWGIGTILAGTSYQAFGYQIKCVGKAYCNFTNWLEIICLILTGISIGLIAPYGLVLVIGAVVPVQILVTYELFNLFFMPLFIWFFVHSIINIGLDLVK